MGQEKSEKLLPLPCPFCGTEAKIRRNPGSWGYESPSTDVLCPGCYVKFTAKTEAWSRGKGTYCIRDSAEAELINKWNTRVAGSSNDAALEACRSSCAEWRRLHSESVAEVAKLEQDLLTAEENHIQAISDMRAEMYRAQRAACEADAILRMLTQQRSGSELNVDAIQAEARELAAARKWRCYYEKKEQA